MVQLSSLSFHPLLDSSDWHVLRIRLRIESSAGIYPRMPASRDEVGVLY